MWIAIGALGGLALASGALLMIERRMDGSFEVGHAGLFLVGAGLLGAVAGALVP